MDHGTSMPACQLPAGMLVSRGGQLPKLINLIVLCEDVDPPQRAASLASPPGEREAATSLIYGSFEALGRCRSNPRVGPTVALERSREHR